jgi:hypothetical protein
MSSVSSGSRVANIVRPGLDSVSLPTLWDSIDSPASTGSYQALMGVVGSRRVGSSGLSKLRPQCRRTVTSSAVFPGRERQPLAIFARLRRRSHWRSRLTMVENPYGFPGTRLDGRHALVGYL